MLQQGDSYEEIVERFRWQIPERYNIGVDICDRHAADRSRVALIHDDDETGTVTEYTFHQLSRLSNRLANALRGLGVDRGDRIGIVLPQRPETALSHLATYKLGAVAVPLAVLFGTDALEYRLRDSGTKVVVVDDSGLEKVLSIRGALPELQEIILVGGRSPPGVQGFDELTAQGDDSLSPVPTRSEDPALLIYTSGTTGAPKGALHAHRVVLGHLPGVEFPHNFAPQPGDRFWTPADWAWAGGLLDVLLPAWHHGLPVVSHHSRRFDPDRAFSILARHGVRNAFMPPTALKMMREVPDPAARYDFKLRSLACGGEALGEEILEWGESTMGAVINEFYGQTEANLVVGNCHEVMEIRPGSMGRRMPGHEVAVLREDGSASPAGEIGEIAVRRPDPVMFLEYWNDPGATAEKFTGDWALTGDLARRDEDGYLWFTGRKDDLIVSSAYRMGPVEIEDSILKHPAVSMAAVIGVPHRVRGSVVKAFIRLKPGHRPSDALAGSIRELVKSRVAAHEYPREVEFVDSLPLTTTGKVMRGELRALEEERRQRNP